MASKNIINILLYNMILISVLFSIHSKAELPRFEHPIKPDGSLSLLVVGDWGRRGAYNQTEVAVQMANIGDQVDPNFIISTGDNFYENGLTGVEDPAFEESFSDIYLGQSLQKQWYSVLGNHDYRGDVLAQLDPILKQKDSRWLCLRSFILNTDVAEFFFVDTTPFVDKYFTNPKDDTYDWRGVLPREEYLSNLLKDLDTALKESSSSWKIVVGHHTIKSAGDHGITHELEKRLLPLLQENHVDLYINGHDHCLQHISSSDSPLQFLTSGGGSKAWRQIIRPWNPNELKLYYDGQGFMTMKLTKSHVDIHFYDVFANVLHQWSSSKGVYSM
ncbi:hypothetical protein ACH5RR_036570 [Cinchona calisaya]|uniref:Purple acid phosphatase n=1 Tax=Cinchona calisaya TaxID=153742 RepID=A0ABD2Y5Y1_9GENT